MNLSELEIQIKKCIKGQFNAVNGKYKNTLWVLSHLRKQELLYKKQFGILKKKVSIKNKLNTI